MTVKVNLPKDLSGKTFLIAGAAGFVPGHVSEFYLNLGAKVIGLDNFITGTKETIEILSKFDNFKFIECDVSEKLPEFDEDINYILSLASPASPLDFNTIPMEIMKLIPMEHGIYLSWQRKKMRDF